MKNLLRSTLYLFVFILSGILFQISCSSDSISNSNNINSTPIGKIAYVKDNSIWTTNYDGTGASQIPIVLPTNIIFNLTSNYSSLSVSPDGNTIFFTCANTTYPNFSSELYSCNINGGNATLVIPASNPSGGTGNVSHVVAF